ncbi:Hypothetical protein CKL_2993 [Clostridium kluyveri DSM 555]|uniref:Uncharacterized protein n=1 Tax=Clostridium kluyveri (strain ATCC 8527 / DSM 555 / NBRC 12016 / NCIMB 10680 / K1) TaxID=431943 RepID=A5N1K5_CLOK5|nr:Hypothetical protein CKL_2993 [Clostridium kluyveri DSM 555]
MLSPVLFMKTVQELFDFTYKFFDYDILSNIYRFHRQMWNLIFSSLMSSSCRSTISIAPHNRKKILKISISFCPKN